MRAVVDDGRVAFLLARQQAAQLHLALRAAAARADIRLQPQHHLRRQLVLGGAPDALLDHLEHVDRVPRACQAQ